MRERGQGLGDRLLLVPPGSTQSSPSPTLSSSCHGLPARVHRTKQVTHKEKWARLGKTPVVVVAVVVVAVWLCGCVAVWLCGCVAVWLCGRVAVWPCGRVAAWPRGRVAAWPRGRVAAWLRGCWLLVVVVVVVWDTVECVCMYTPHNAHLQAKS